MAKDTEISWAHHSCNFWWGCLKVDEDCLNCYALTLSKRFGKQIWGPVSTTEREIKKAIWKDVLKWDKEAGEVGERRRLFVLSMGDFLEDHPMVAEPRKVAMGLLENLRWMDVLILTKRPENYELLQDWLPRFPPHIWMGTSVGHQPAADKRVPALLRIPARVRFLSVEPMTGPVNILKWLMPGADGTPEEMERDHDWIDWVICGGESGKRFRPMEVKWAQDLRDQCKTAGVPFFMKQDCGLKPGMQGRLPDELWNCKEFPEVASIDEFPF